MKKRTCRKQTDIEKELSEILEEQSVVYVREYKLGTYSVDFYVPGSFLSLQADGGYWHTYCSNCSVKEKATIRQKYQALKDLACIAFHKRFKRSILRFCECEIKDNKEFVKESILKAIEEIGKGNLVYRSRKLSSKRKKK